MITFNKKHIGSGKGYEFKFFSESAPETADKISQTGVFKNSVMEQITLVCSADLDNPFNKKAGFNKDRISKSRAMAASLIRKARNQK